MPTLWERVHDLLDYTNTAGPLERAATARLVGLILVNVVAVILASEPGIAIHVRCSTPQTKPLPSSVHLP